MSPAAARSAAVAGAGRRMTVVLRTYAKEAILMKQRFWAMLIALLMFCTGAMADGSVCETCGGRGYLEMQSFDSEGTVRVV